MTRIYTSATIRRPVEVVYDYVTTPGHWPEWHPSSLGVLGAADHALVLGEQVTEHYRVAGREGTVVWTVREREAPRRWLIEGSIVGGMRGGPPRNDSEGPLRGTVTYTLTPRNGSTYFEREFVYPVPRLLLRLLDALVVRRRIQAESAEALRRLQARLEAGEAPASRG